MAGSGAATGTTFFGGAVVMTAVANHFPPGAAGAGGKCAFAQMSVMA